jgi:hypothetical protein
MNDVVEDRKAGEVMANDVVEDREEGKVSDVEILGSSFSFGKLYILPFYYDLNK